MGGGADTGEVSEADYELASKKIKMNVEKENLVSVPCLIQTLTRLETEEELQERLLRDA